MDTFKFDSLARLLGSGMTRREALRGLVAGAAAVATSSALLTSEEAAAGKRKRRKRCSGKNWCLDRTQTCGPVGGYGKCLVDVSGNHMCAELLFQATSCTECGPANCTNCRCVKAVGADKCNNGPNGYDFICVRKV
jgi:hypothetical protein